MPPEISLSALARRYGQKNPIWAPNMSREEADKWNKEYKRMQLEKADPPLIDPLPQAMVSAAQVMPSTMGLMAAVDFLRNPKQILETRSPYAILAGTVEPMGDKKVVEGMKAKSGRGVPTIRGMAHDEALDFVRNDSHLRVNPKTGQIIGAPVGITMDNIGEYRANLDKKLGDAHKIAKQSDWYPRAGGGIEEVAGPNPQRQETVSRTHALMSAQSTPDVDTGATNKQYARGLVDDRTPVRTGEQTEKFFEAQDTGQPIRLGPKTGVYWEKFAQYMSGLRDRLNQQMASTNDIWHGRFMGFANKDGSQLSKGLSRTQHAFLDAETMLLADRANVAKLGGHSEWNLSNVQAVPWIAWKATDLFKKRPKLGWEGAVKEAQRTYLETIPKYRAFLTDEAVTGKGIEHLPGLADASPEVKQAYTDDYRRRWTTPEGRDLRLDEMGVLQEPTTEATGNYTRKGGQPESSPVIVSRPQVGFEGVKEGEPVIDAASRRLFNARANQVAISAAQNMAGGSKPIFEGKVGRQNSLHISQPGPVSPQRLRDLEAIGAQYGLPNAIDYGNGVSLTNFGEEATGIKVPTGTELGASLKGKAATKKKPAVEGLASKLSTYFGNETPTVQRVYLDTLHADYQDALAAHNAGKGIATRQFLKEWRKDPKAFNRLDTPTMAERMGSQAAYDETMVPQLGPVRQDIQNFRNIWAQNPGDVYAAFRRALKEGSYLPGLGVAGMVGAGAAAQYSPDEEERQGLIY